MKPILFNTKMVRATLAGMKTATRRLIKDPFYIDDEDACRKSGMAVHKGTSITDGMPYPEILYEVGEILYVRETWATTEDGHVYLYRADANPAEGGCIRDKAGKLHAPRWRPSIHMPKEAARIFLRVTGVRVERLQEIDAEGVLAEGMTSGAAVCGDMEIAAKEFALLWNRTIKPEKLDIYGWEANPWVWVIEFEQISREEARG